MNGKKIQRRKYKNDKPYNGFFLRQDFESPIFDYYKKGVKKYQYSTAKYRQTQNDSIFNSLKPLLKSKYKNNKIFNGVEFVSYKNGSCTKIVKKRKIKEIIFWEFPIHYGTKLFLRKKEGGQIEITEPKHPNLKVILDNKNTSLIFNNEILEKNKERM